MRPLIFRGLFYTPCSAPLSIHSRIGYFC